MTTITLATACRKLELTSPATRKLVEKGQLKATKVDGEWAIDRDSVNSFLADRRRAEAERRKQNNERKAALLANQRAAIVQADRLQTELHGSISDAIAKLVHFADAVRRMRSDLFEEQEARP